MDSCSTASPARRAGKSAAGIGTGLGILVWAAATLQGAAPPTPNPVLPHHKLIVISIDGLDSRFLRDADRLHIKVPTLRRMMATGLSADVVVLPPATTWSSHAVIATGVPPALNGIAADEKPGKPDDRYWLESDLKVSPIWHAAALKGLKTATIYWPSTVGAHVDFDCPEYWEGRLGSGVDFNQVTSKCTPGLIDHVAKWDNSFIAPLWDDSTGIDVMRYLVNHEQPDLILLHLPEVAAEQHDTTALSIYARKILENDDDLLATALQKLSPGTIVAITSDHGLDTEVYVVRPKVLVKAAGLADTVFVKYGLIGTTSPKAAALLRKSVGVKRSGIAREVPLAELHRLAPDLETWVAAFDTTLNYVASEEARGLAVSTGSHRGVEGMWPTHDSSRAVFIVSGEGIRHARLPEISILDEAPTFAEILGVKLPKAKGTSVLATTPASRPTERTSPPRATTRR